MNATADAFMAIFGYRPCTCETCKHSMPSVVYPMCYCPVKGSTKSIYDHCQTHAERKK